MRNFAEYSPVVLKKRLNISIYMNKCFLVILSLGISTLSFAQKNKISVFELDQINGLFFQRNTIDPFTGTALDKHSNGKKKLSVPIKNGKFQGTVREWAKDGTKIYEAEYNQGKQHGKELQWYANGEKKVELNYIEGQPSGICTEWHKNGKKKSEGNFALGKEEGRHYWWFANGQMDQEIPYKNGEANGSIKNWYINGQLKLEGEYEMGQKHGKTTKWFEDGQKKSVEFFQNDKAEDEAKYWSSKGILHTIRIYKAGRLIQEKNYRSGNVNVGNGYVQVYNEPESFFKISITGSSVRPVDMKNITYIMNGRLLQLFNISADRFRDTVNTDEKDKPFLEAYLAYEAGNLKQRTSTFDFDLKKEFFKTKNGLEAVHWYFEAPSKFAEAQTSRTVQEEHYVSVLCNKQVLSLYSAVTKSDPSQEVATMLKSLADEVIVKSERIDLNQIVADLRE